MNRPPGPKRKNVVDLGEDDTLFGEFTADRGIYISLDGQRRQEELLNVGHKKRRLEPSQLNDSLAVWIPVPDNGSYEEEGTNGDEGSVDVPSAPVLGKRKTYASTVSMN